MGWSIILSSSLTLIASSLIYIINNINTTRIEKKLMSNFQRYKFVLSLSLIASFVVSALITLLYLIEGNKLEINLFIGLFISSLAIYIFVLTIVEVFFVYKSRKYTFYISLDEYIKWEIIKVTNDRGLLLRQGEEYKVINDYYDMPITIEKNKK